MLPAGTTASASRHSVVTAWGPFGLPPEGFEWHEAKSEAKARAQGLVIVFTWRERPDGRGRNRRIISARFARFAHRAERLAHRAGRAAAHPE
jgi:hypothetical protein